MEQDIDRRPPEGAPGGFNYIRFCGSGGFGEAWLVTEPYGALRVLKLIRKNAANNYESEKKGLLTYYEKIEEMPKEEKDLFVPILHNGENDDFFYYTMTPADRLDGNDQKGYVPKTLKNLLFDENLKVRLDARQIADISLRILKALKVLRSHDIVHRDIKPDNIFFIKGEPCLGDISLMQSAAGFDLFFAEAGKDEFIPPECRAEGGAAPVVGPEWDLYSFGKVLYCMDTGKEAFLYPTQNLTNPSTNEAITDIWKQITAENREDRLTNIDKIIERFNAIRTDSERRRPTRAQIAMATAIVAIIAIFCFSFITILTRTNYNTIFDAIADNNLPGVIRRLKKGDTLSMQNDDKEFPITFALKTPDIDIGIIQELYQNGAYVTGQEKSSHIEQAISSRQQKHIIAFLIENASRINETKDSEGGNLLHTAIRFHDNESFLMLLPLLDVNSIDRNGHSALMQALFTGQSEIAQRLIDMNADLSFRDKNGFTLLHVVKGGKDSRELTTQLLRVCNVNEQNNFKETPLLLAVRRRAPKEFVEQLLENGADPNLQDSEGLSPLSEAIALDSRETFELLLKANARVDSRDSNGFTPMHTAAIYGRNDLLARLIALKADVNAKDDSGRTPLHRAAMTGRGEIIRTLLDAGADSSARDALGLLPSDMLAIFGFDSLAASLPPSDTDKDTISKYSLLISLYSLRHQPLAKDARESLATLLSTPIDIKNSSETSKLYTILIGDPDISPHKGEADPIRLAIDHQPKNILIKLLACAPDINIADESGVTPALATALSNKSELLEYLCYCGADISAKTNDGLDIFSLADRYNSPDVIALMGISMHETMLGLQLPAHVTAILEKSREYNPKVTPSQYMFDNNIFTADDFVLVKIRKKNTSAVIRTLSMGLSTPNAETGVGNYALSDEDIHYIMLKALLSLGAQPNIRSTSGNNALCKSIYDSKQFYYIRLLLDYGANPTLKDSLGSDAFKAAAESSYLSHTRLLEFYHPDNKGK